MSKQIEPKRALAKAVRIASKMASNQALALDEIFTQAVKSAGPGDLRFHEDMRMALKAQAQYRATLKILLALEKERTEQEKSRNSSKQTIESGDSPA